MAAPRVDNPEIPKEGSRWVTVPDTDLFDQPHPPIRINLQEFGPGKHYIPNTLADTVEERLKVAERANRRILQPNRDTQAENTVAVAGTQRGNGVPISPA